MINKSYLHHQERPVGKFLKNSERIFFLPIPSGDVPGTLVYKDGLNPCCSDRGFPQSCTGTHIFPTGTDPGLAVLLQKPPSQTLPTIAVLPQNSCNHHGSFPCGEGKKCRAQAENIDGLFFSLNWSSTALPQVV